MLYTYPIRRLWVGYLKVSMAVWFPVPAKLWSNVDAQLSQNDLEKSHPMCGEKTTPLDCSFNECVMLVGTRLGHEMKTDSERRLPPTAWLHCFQEQPGVSRETPIHLDEGGWKKEQGRSLGKLSNCRNWSIWNTAGRNISETCSFQMNQRKIQNTTT